MSKFSYNQKFYNSLILNRVPHYGDGNPDGCIVMGEIYLSLVDIGNSKITGQIKDVNTLEALAGANVKVYLAGNEIPKELKVSHEGTFEIIKNLRATKLEVNYIGYRSLVIDLNRRKLL